jgi:S1-C subfamily serine protease
MTSLPPSDPVHPREPEDDLADFRPMTARLLARRRGGLLLLVATLLLVPVGAWLVDQGGTGRAGEEEVVPAVGLGQDELRSQAVMLVLSAACGENSRCGSGFALEIDGEAVVVTNRHVVEGACSTTVRPFGGGDELAVREVRLASDADVAVLVVDEEENRAPLVVGTDLLLGQEVRVIGFPGAEPTVLSGYVRRIEPARLVLAMGADHGASGSPVVDATGAVVGQLYARLEEECCVAMPIADVVAAAREAEPVTVCP